MGLKFESLFPLSEKRVHFPYWSILGSFRFTSSSTSFFFRVSTFGFRVWSHFTLHLHLRGTNSVVEFNILIIKCVHFFSSQVCSCRHTHIEKINWILKDLREVARLNLREGNVMIGETWGYHGILATSNWFLHVYISRRDRNKQHGKLQTWTKFCIEPKV